MKFFVILNNQQEGPYTIAQLAEMGISSETLVWKEGMKDWQPAWTIPELRYILNEKTTKPLCTNDVYQRESLKHLNQMGYFD